MMDWDNYSIYDLVALEEKDDQLRYMTKTLTAFKAIEQVYAVKSARDREAREEHRIVLSFLQKLHHTFDLLGKKYLFHPTDRIKIDKNDSGFVNFYEISLLEADLQAHGNASAREDKGRRIKQKMVDSLLGGQPVSPELLADMARNEYQKGLKRDVLFLFFNEGELALRGTAPSGNRKFFYYWSCYDKRSNRPYIYFLDFEQDIEAPNLLEDKEAHDAFLQVIRSEGMRAPAAGLVAMAIDQRLEQVHPKMLKRICLGPIYSPTFSVGLNDDLLEVFQKGDPGERFVCHLTEQFVFSVGQTIIKDRKVLGKMLAKKRVRERFYIPGPADIADLDRFTELDEQKASLIRKSVVMPYILHQHVKNVYQGFTIISFTRSGSINGV